ncbi:SGS-domain-containing protein [Mollisia scopiformis]|uniref:SGS-domain-containing protein n=1 Tax=Mollisia scopiformis TaxID=149040 RepID=A0A194XBC4_MOLSC|nr:SGS-domain-containing protein [Mollisia scopiformis]KUJ17466.1 SGS-domain-containing protein [Mollisia scopiformis]
MAEVGFANKGQAAIQAGDYATAINYLTQAIQISKSPLWLTWRATAYQRTKQYELALADGDNAVLAAIKRSKRDLIANAHFRRAVALHGLKRYGDARMCLHWVKEYNEKEKGLTIWLAKIKTDYDNAGGDEAECNQVTVKKVPDEVEDVSKDTKPAAKEKVEAPAVAAIPVAPAQTPKEKIRHEWYQSPTTITIEIFAKGVPKENTEVKIEAGSLEVSFPLSATDSTFDYTIDPFFSKVDVSKSSHRITPHKIEIVLHKSTPGLKWSALEGTDLIPSEPVKEDTKAAVQLPKQETAPVYPTSSKSGPKNWDKLMGEEDDDDGEGEDVDRFFKKLYKGADPDTRRAMMKSYQESNGTSLSTNWSDVGSKTFETSPPDGLEAKKWES